jgi:hypothetical protein
MSKIHKERSVFRFSNSFGESIKWKDIKHFQFEDDDRIEISREEECEDNDYRPDWCCYVSRSVLETDKEYEERIEQEKQDDIRKKKMRYEHFVRLKSEFEPENGN